MRVRTRLSVVWCLMALAGAGAATGCGDEGAASARRTIRTQHAREIQRLIATDVERHLRGVAEAGTRIAAGFAVVDSAERAAQMRTALRLLTKPPRGIPELIVSPRTFTAAVAPSGVVLATDAKQERDRMTGVDLGARFAVVRRALAGEGTSMIEQFPAIEAGTEGSVSLLFAAPARKQTSGIGAVLTGMPLWRLSQRLTKQLQLDHAGERGTILWVYLLRGDTLHHFGTPPDLDQALPTAEQRAAGLARSPGGFTGEFLQFGRWYAYGVVPLRALGADMRALIVRADPT